jgi:hypothetical protein
VTFIYFSEKRSFLLKNANCSEHFIACTAHITQTEKKTMNICGQDLKKDLKWMRNTFSEKRLDFDVNQSIHVKANFSEKDDFGDRKDISCLKAFAFSIVFFSLATSSILTLLAHGQSRAAWKLPTPYPTAFHSLRHGWQQRKKTRQTGTERVSCYPVGCVTSLVTIITNGRSRRDLPLATSWHRVLPPTSPKICVSKREETMRQFGDNAHAQRDTSDTLVTETALALLRKQLTELGTTVINVLLSSIFFLSIFGYRFFFLWLNISLNELIQ